MVNKRRKTTVRRKTVRRKSRHGGLKSWLRQHRPGWAWWIGVLLVTVGCIWALYRYFTQPDQEQIAFPEGYTVYGIDVSHYQETINWELFCNQGLIRNNPVHFVFIKATQGIDKVDPTFAHNFQQARKYGFHRSAYHFFEPQVSAKAQAAFFIKNVTLEEGDLPPVLDVETAPQGMSEQAFKWSVLEWLSLIEHHYQVKPILYTGYSFKMRYLNDVVFDHYPYWIAHYGVDKVAYKGPWCFWQFSEKGQLPGIKGAVDLDVFNGTLEELKELTLQPPASPDPE